MVLFELPDEFIKSVNDVLGLVEQPLNIFEQTVRGLIPDQAKQLDTYLTASQHPLTKQLPLMNPYHVVAIMLFYLSALVFCYVLTKFFLPKLSLKPLVILHNIILTVWSLYMFVETAAEALNLKYSVWGNGLNTEAKYWPMAKMIWLFYISKIYEFLDTFIMMFKQNYRQVSFLHVYHHCTMLGIWWLVTFEAPGGDSYFSAAQNAGIHVIMYSYYLYCSLLPKQDGTTKPSKKKGFQGKHIITCCQMAQFAANLAQGYFMWKLNTGNNFPAHLGMVLFFYMITMLILFGNFLMADAGKNKKHNKKE